MAIFKDEKKTKDGRQWYFRFYYNDINNEKKQYKSKKYLTKNEAQKEESIFSINNDIIANKKMLFRELRIIYLEKLKKESKSSTVYGHNSVILTNIAPYFDEDNIYDINTLKIEKWHRELDKKELSTNYKNKCHMIMQSILRVGVKFYSLNINAEEIVGPFKDSQEDVITDEEKLRYITYQEFKKFISFIDDIKWNTFFSFLYYTGMRKGEVQALTWSDIDFNNKEIIVNKTLTVKVPQEEKNRTDSNYKITSTKNLRNRKVKINKSLLDLLKKYYEFEKKYVGFEESWFVFGELRFLPQTTIDHKKHEYFVKSKIHEITIHEFRHSHVSLLINEFVNSGQNDSAKFFIMMSSRMGHTIDVMQKTYMHLFPNIQDKIIDILDNL